MFRAAGLETAVIATTAPGSAGAQARHAVECGYDTVIACGGDGTAHEALQGVVGSDAALGFIPLGTGNALGQDLGIPRHPVAAARMLLDSELCRVPTGVIEQPASGAKRRFFLMLAGMGADAEMLYRLAVESKRRFGILAYYAMAARLWLTHRFIPFEVEFVDLDRGERRRETVNQLLAVHISDFGGILRELCPRAALARSDFQLVLFKTNRRTRYLRYVMGAFLRQHWPVAGIEIARADAALCRPIEDARRVYVEADGELLGTLPARIGMASQPVHLLVPRKRLSRFSMTTLPESAFRRPDSQHW